MRTMQAAFVAKEKLKCILHDSVGVSGIGVSKASDGEPGLRVQLNPSVSAKDIPELPSEVDEFPVEIVRLHEAIFQSSHRDRSSTR